MRLVLVDQASLSGDNPGARLALLAERHASPALVLLTRGGAPSPLADVPGAWSRIVRRPASVGDLVATVQQIFPLPPESSRPLE